MPVSDHERTDYSVGVAGYRAQQNHSVSAGPRAILKLWQRENLQRVRIEMCTWEELAIIRRLVSDAAANGESVPELCGGGPQLCFAEPTSEREYWVRTEEEIRQATAFASAAGTGWLPVRPADPEQLLQVQRHCHDAGLRLALRGNYSAASQLQAGDYVATVVNVLRADTESPLQVLQRWATDAAIGEQRLRELLSRGVDVGTELMALRRSVFIRESLEAPFLEELVPILPHAVYLREMKRPGGYLVGRRALKERAGITEGNKVALAEAETGWQALLQVVGRVLAAANRFPGKLRLGTRAPQLALVPGYAVLEEQALLTFAQEKSALPTR